MNSWTAGVSFGATYYQGGSLGHAGRVPRKNLSSFGKVGQKSQQIRPINEFLSNSLSNALIGRVFMRHPASGAFLEVGRSEEVGGGKRKRRGKRNGKGGRGGVGDKVDSGKGRGKVNF